MKPTQSKSLKLKERDIVRQVRDYSELYFGIHLYQIRENPWTSEPGIPDLFGNTERGRAVYVEVKIPGGKRRPAQIAFIQKAIADGCAAMFAESLEEFILGMNGFGIYGRGQKEKSCLI